jgi:hypothetical protein
MLLFRYRNGMKIPRKNAGTPVRVALHSLEAIDGGALTLPLKTPGVKTHDIGTLA